MIGARQRCRRSKTLDAFYNKKLKTVVRFLPALADQLSGEEEHLQPNVMDSWYLHHPLLNLWRLASISG